MLLRQKMAVQTLALIVGLLFIAAAGLWGINALHQDFGLALRGYAQLRRVYNVASHIAAARSLLNADRPHHLKALNVQVAKREAQAALLALRQPETEAADERDRRIDTALRGPIEHFLAAMTAAEDGHSDAADYAALAPTLDALLGKVPGLVAEIRQSIEQYEKAAAHKRRATIILTAILSGIVVIVGIAVGILQYRSVMRPLSHLAGGVKRIAGGSFSQRLPAEGAGEFVALARDFNHMAGELEELYRELEQKVAIKSKELVRSERLASVGYLAAGVAHEINNPLGIITGHAELLLKQLHTVGDGAASGTAEQVIGSLRIICEEAFRCKDITQKLLSLARPGADGRTDVPLARVARDVVTMLSGLGEFRDRKLTLTADADENTVVVASEGEMRQVLLNLAINALQAVPASGGEVRVEVRRADGEVEVSVTDNGRGMTAATLERIFEPFFSEKRGERQPGTGLGLSITHAIVEDHGGTIRAHSDGPGKGSRFVVRIAAKR